MPLSVRMAWYDNNWEGSICNNLKAYGAYIMGKLLSTGNF